MRKDVKAMITGYTREERCLLNKSEMARRYNCDPRTISRHLKIEKGELKPAQSNRKYISKLDDYKSIIINKVDVHGVTAMGVYKFIQKKGYSGKYSTVAAFVRKHKEIETKKATIRFETTPGLQAQVQMSNEKNIVGSTHLGS